METADQADRIAALEDRLRQLEDRLAIFQLISSWGPAADTGNGEAASSLWTDDAVLVTENGQLQGTGAIREMIDSEGQQALVRRGCAHVQGLPRVHVDGDRATAVNYGRVYLHGEDGYEVWRASVNVWDFRRGPEGWRASRRRVHVIDGGPEALELLGVATGDLVAGDT